MTTRRRDLRTGRSLWQTRRLPALPHGRLKRDIDADVLVVGAGITGALVAEALAADHRVVVVDRRGPAAGSTSASTALIEYEIDTPLIHLAKAIGAEPAARAWQRSHRAVHALAERTAALGIGAGILGRDNLYLAGNVLDAAGLAEEAAARRALGLEARFLPRAALKERFGIARAGAILSHGDFGADPRQLAAGFLAAAIGAGARLFAPADIVRIETSGDGVLAGTAGGPVVNCKQAIFCTGYELPDFVPAKGHRVISTYAMATRPQPGRLWPEGCLVWEASAPYLYVRATPDGRVVCGGEDEDFADAEARDALIPRKLATIRRKLGQLFPGLDTEPDFAWAGAFGTTATGLPTIGPVPGKPHVWAVLGFGGNGTTYARIAADIIAADFGGRSDPDGGLYAFASAAGSSREAR